MEWMKMTFLCTVLVAVITCKVCNCTPVPETASKVNSVDGGDSEEEHQDNQLLLKDEISTCYLELHMIVISGNKAELSDTCKTLLEVMSNCKGKDCAFQGDQPEPTVSLPASSDLQKELQSLTSQLREIEADYGEVKRDGPEAGQLEKSTKEKKGLESEQFNSRAKPTEEMASKDNDVGDDEALDIPIDTPFMTSSKSGEEEFLVIPINYLKNELEVGEAMTRGDDDDLAKQATNGASLEPLTNDNDAAKEHAKSADNVVARDDGESVSDGDVSELEAALAAMQDRDPNDNSVDALSRIQVDIKRLGDDLKKFQIS